MSLLFGCGGGSFESEMTVAEEDFGAGIAGDSPRRFKVGCGSLDNIWSDLRGIVWVAFTEASTGAVAGTLGDMTSNVGLIRTTFFCN